MQPTPFNKWAERSKFPCSSVYWWQPKHLALDSAGEASLNVKILVLSPPPSTCSLPGP